VAAGGQSPRPAFSNRFTLELKAIGASGINSAHGTPDAAEIAAGLPVPLVDSADPAAGYLATLSTLGPAQQVESLQARISADSDTAGGTADGVEVHLALARASLAAGAPARAIRVLTRLTGRGQVDWRVTWYRGLAEVLSGRLPEAQAAFEAVYDELPGELAPKLALGLIAEATGNQEAAAKYFGIVWTTDRSYSSAAFGLARVRLAAGDRPAAVDVLGAVPDTSIHHQAAQIAAVRARLSPSDPGALSAGDLTDADARLDGMRLDAAMLHTLTIEVLQAGLRAVRAGMPRTGSLLGCELTEDALRLGIERSYRALARLSSTPHERYALVDSANAIRPRTLT